MSDQNDVSKAAKKLGRLGGLKGGHARAAKLTPEERSDIARKAVETRWAKQRTGSEVAKIPQATHEGIVEIGPLRVACCNLEDGRRVLSEREFTKSLGGKRGGSHWQRRKKGDDGAELPVFLSAANLRPYVPTDLVLALTTPILYRPIRGGVANGIDATVIPKICTVFLAARAAKALHRSQEDIAHQAEIMMRALAEVAIVALVDEATGFQADREKEELQRLLKAYIRQGEMRKWECRFPIDYYRELFRLLGWSFDESSSKRPRLLRILNEQTDLQKIAARCVRGPEEEKPSPQPRRNSAPPTSSILV